MAFLAPLAFLGLLIAIPIILLYMLRLRRREVVISSTFLWQQILQDQEANTPWQRLRRNLLLILQLIILVLMVLAIARPFITVPAVSAGQTAIILDASASMKATDLPDVENRFEAAKNEALEVTNTLSAGTLITVIRAGSTPEVLSPYTADRDLTRAAINAAVPGDAPSDWLGAMTLAAAGGSGVEDFTIVIIGDGGIDETVDFSSLTLPGEVRFIGVGAAPDNVALAALATRALPGQAPQLFGQITNYSDSEAEVVLNLRVDGDSVPLVSNRYTIPAGSELPIVSTGALDTDFATLQADLTLSVNSQAQDYLTVDNTAWAISRTSAGRSILMVTEGNLFLEQVLRSVPGIDLIRGQVNRPLPSRPYDLYVFDGTLPTVLPDGDMLIINPPRSTSLFSLGETLENVGDITVEANDSRMAFVDFGNVSILRFRQVRDTGWATPLIQSTSGPLLLAGESEGRQIAVISFDLRESDLPLQITWPVLVSNLLEWFTPSDVLTTSGNLNVGDPVIVRPPLEADRVQLTKPDGTTRSIDVTRDTLILTDTDLPGLYTLDVFAGEEVIRSQVFPVNLFVPLESSIRPREVTLNGVALSGDVREEPGQFEFWPIAALLALLMLMIEWYAYHQRLQVRTVFGTGYGRGGTPPPSRRFRIPGRA